MAQSDNISELSKSMIAVQAQLHPAVKDATNPFCKNKYATLNSVMDSCRDALTDHGIWLTQLPCPAPVELGPGFIGLETKLIHAESGQWLSSMTVIPLPKADPQGLGSAITYARRYAICAVLGIVTEDDDGNAASYPSGRQDPIPQPPQNGGHKQYRKQKNPMESLPKLDGVSYSQGVTDEGRGYVVATGNTLPKIDILRKSGFIWNQNQKIWWKYLDQSAA